jgi:hypothetical protein
MCIMNENMTLVFSELLFFFSLGEFPVDLVIYKFWS